MIEGVHQEQVEVILYLAEIRTIDTSGFFFRMLAIDLREPGPTEHQYLGTPPKAQRWGASDVDKPSVQLSYFHAWN